MDTTQVTKEGNTKIERHTQAIVNLRRAESNVVSAETELANATNDLGKWMMPNDALVGETIGVWKGDTISLVTKLVDNGYKIVDRKR